MLYTCQPFFFLYAGELSTKGINFSLRHEGSSRLCPQQGAQDWHLWRCWVLIRNSISFEENLSITLGFSQSIVHNDSNLS